MNTNQTNSNQPLSRHEARAQRRAERRGGANPGAWIGGLLLIGLGVILFLQNQGVAVAFPFNNWWAPFILLPALGAFGNAWRVYQAEGRLNAAARGSLLVGLVLTVVAAAFLFELNWTLLGPALLLMAGIGVLANSMLRG
jgi:hypothetical protein